MSEQGKTLAPAVTRTTHTRPMNRKTQRLLNDCDYIWLRRRARRLLLGKFPTLAGRGGHDRWGGGYADAAVDEAVVSMLQYFQEHVAESADHPRCIAARAILNQLNDLCTRYVREHRDVTAPVHRLGDDSSIGHEPVDSHAAQPLDNLIRVESIRADLQLLELLRPRHRQAIELRHILGMTAVKAAEIMDISESMLNRLLREAQRDLRHLEVNSAARAQRAKEVTR